MTLTEPQIWTLIVGAMSVFIAMLALTWTLVFRVMKAGFEKFEAKFEAIYERIDRLDEKFTLRFDVLDRDVNALMKHVFGIDRE